jgi:DNA-binding FadR family transcriptional regulator
MLAATNRATFAFHYRLARIQKNQGLMLAGIPAASLVDSDVMWECQNILCMPDRLRVAKSSKAMIRYRHGYAGYILN